MDLLPTIRLSVSRETEESEVDEKLVRACQRTISLSLELCGTSRMIRGLRVSKLWRWIDDNEQGRTPTSSQLRK
jgi:hypothetical protein